MHYLTRVVVQREAAAVPQGEVDARYSAHQIPGPKAVPPGRILVHWLEFQPHVKARLCIKAKLRQKG